MIKIFLTNCKNCGAPLSYHGGKSKCDYCGTEYLENTLTDIEIEGHKFYVGDIEVKIICPEIPHRDMHGQLIREKPKYKRRLTLIEY